MAEANKDERTLVIDDKTYNVSDFNEEQVQMYNKLAVIDGLLANNNDALIKQSVLVEGLQKQKAEQVALLQGTLDAKEEEPKDEGGKKPN
tara:strand:+ start:2432 stop:2701 length:270 start_codon:yes stop_codon:yes gene_type:complete